MEAKKIGGVGPESTRHRPLPAPLSAFDALPGTPRRSAEAPLPAQPRARRLHHRPLAAFLAQLALQYDDIAQRRRARRALRQAASTRYGEPVPTRLAGPWREPRRILEV